jgi:hypothetical protein
VRTHGRWLWLLTALFALRVAAQPLALVVDAPWLPRFEAWHGGVLPYPVLLLSQLAILAWLVRTAWRISTGAAVPRPTVGRLLLGAAGFYGGVMVLRLLLGATMLRDDRWFASPVPTAFHLVLAGYLFLLGRFHLHR